MTKVIDLDDALALLVAVVDERGSDYVYVAPGDTDWSSRCFYERDGKPSCGVGLALAKAGVSVEELIALDEAGLGKYPVTPRMYELFRNHVASVEITRSAAEVFKEFQVWQDRGDTYSAALSGARRVAR